MLQKLQLLRLKFVNKYFFNKKIKAKNIVILPVDKMQDKILHSELFWHRLNLMTPEFAGFLQGRTEVIWVNPTKG